ncbi:MULTISPECIES: STAS/SEC14 domain-containing protein [unclassified Pseudoalteromonas]|uniref:STAS/SEC14 domain-containing protein n=1 Tax=unclassified Pseudoalteromonas TaxID=194690 RepID=UPI000CF70B82|nr:MULTISPECIES: STAS/SEC14 domain-containing protein [unclassified Pseudoalteromonas]MBS3797180.1 STAS/SEC14 domain-containing protein [Pseudoalteromonas sp. BDTF-M6]
MLCISLDDEHDIGVFTPHGQLSAADFVAAVRIIDPYIERRGPLKGLMIATRHFPGWDSFAALSAHLRFARDHHKQIGRIALVTDSPMAMLGEHLAAHFISAEIKAFKYDQIEQARAWLRETH